MGCDRGEPVGSAHVEIAGGTAAAASSLIRLIRDPRDPAPDHPSLVRMLKRAGRLYPFRPTDTTYLELSGGGNLSLIRDREPRSALPRELGALAGNEELVRALAMVLDSATVVRESMTDLISSAASLSSKLNTALDSS